MAQKVIDTHIHLAKDWKEGEGGLPNEWLPCESASFQRNWTEVPRRRRARRAPRAALDRMRFLACALFPQPPSTSCTWHRAVRFTCCLCFYIACASRFHHWIHSAERSTKSSRWGK